MTTRSRTLFPCRFFPFAFSFARFRPSRLGMAVSAMIMAAGAIAAPAQAQLPIPDPTKLFQDPPAEPDAAVDYTDKKTIAQPEEAFDPSDPDQVEKRLKQLEERERQRRIREREPLEYMRSRIAPADVIPYLKPHHWGAMMHELRSNREDYKGRIDTSETALEGLGQAVTFRIAADLPKEQDRKVVMPIFAPKVGLATEMLFNLSRAETDRPELSWTALLRRLEPHQMLVLAMAKDPAPYARWGKMQSTIPVFDNGDGSYTEKFRYYRILVPQEPIKALLSAHPLTWTYISHAIWDDLPANDLRPDQYAALLDWLHFGGQLTIIAPGGGASIGPLADSPLGPVLPAIPSGANYEVTDEELRSLETHYRPPRFPLRSTRYELDAEDQEDLKQIRADNQARELLIDELAIRYYKPVPIAKASKEKFYLAGLQPKPGATLIPLGTDPNRPLAAEWRVGRGRVTILAIDPNHPVLTSWGGRDTLIRRVVLRRPEEPTSGNAVRSLTGPELTWVKYFCRDIGAPETDANPSTPPTPFDPSYDGTDFTGIDFNTGKPLGGNTLRVANREPPRNSTAAWLDDALIPRECRSMLTSASGISIPEAGFVVKVLLAYILVLVPVNYVVCRFLIRRREWAWAIAPLLALGFAIGVERASAFDLGFDSACDEIAILELQPNYPRGHVSRFAAVTSTSRGAYTIAYPLEPTALALPMNMKLGLRGQSIEQSVFQYLPEPALIGLPIQPRSITMFRSEHLQNIGGTLQLDNSAWPWKVSNSSRLRLVDAQVVRMDRPNDPQDLHVNENYVASIGTIEPGAVVEIKEADFRWISTASRALPETKAERNKSAAKKAAPSQPRSKAAGAAPKPEAAGSASKDDAAAGDEEAPGEDWKAKRELSPESFAPILLRSSLGGLEDRGEVRLVARVEFDGHFPGQVFEPDVDRKRGFTFVVAHLKYGPPPDPFAAPYTSVTPETRESSSESPATPRP